MSKYYDMVDKMNMPEGQREKLRMELMEQAAKKTNVRPVWQRYAVAAALALCLMTTAVTAYAAVRYQWFQMFFDNGEQKGGMLEEFVAKASTEEVSAENENYKFTVLSHLYSKEQQMGMVICSFQFLKENEKFLAANDRRRKEAVILKRDTIITEGQEFLENEENAAGWLNFKIADKAHTEMLSANTVYFANEIAEDGGYLIGIRYNVSVEGAVNQEPELYLSLENAGDVENKLNMRLPESKDIETVHFVSERNSQDRIVISPIGMSLTFTGDKAVYQDQIFEDENLRNVKLVMKDSVKTMQDMGEGYESSVLLKETDTTYTWYVQKEFLNLEYVSGIDHIELDGVAYQK